MVDLINEDILVGSKEISTSPLKPFDLSVINFLNEISKSIYADKKKNYNSEIKTFGFFCRKKNIERLKKIHLIENNNSVKMGLGLAFHVTPSNIPTNFAYSLVFGLLTGNSNVVKLPSQSFVEIDQICMIIKKVLRKFTKLKRYITIVRTKNNENFSIKLSMISDLRIIWGGNETVNSLKKISTNERCRDIYFPNRNSLCVINTDVLSKKNDKEIINVCRNFYNDTFLVDQNACSSPHLIYWVGKKNKKVVNVFWKTLEQIVLEKGYKSFFSGSYFKYNRLCNDIINSKNLENFQEYSNFYCINLKKNNFDLDQLVSKLGYFYQVEVDNLYDIFKNINTFTQTITYFGFKKDEIKNEFYKLNLKGVDRIVPIGQALSIELDWDGYELFSSMTRTTSIR